MRVPATQAKDAPARHHRPSRYQQISRSTGLVVAERPVNRRFRRHQAPRIREAIKRTGGVFFAFPDRDT